jgi:A/G-specific adenine glycosylase
LNIENLNPQSVLPNFQSSIFNLQLIAKGVKHVLTHRILYADFYLWVVDERPVLPDDYIWIKESELDDYAKPRLIETLIATI